MSHSYQMLIGERWETGKGEGITVVDPATEEVIGTIPRGNADDVDRAVKAARHAFDQTWRKLKPRERARILYDTGRAIEERIDDFARLETLDSGKPLQLSHKEVLSTARYFEYYAGAADKLEGRSIPLGPDFMDFTIREPMGVTAHVVPWNMPFNMIGRSVAPALAAGNTAVVKPSEMTSLTALELGRVFQSVGLPHGVYNVVTGYGLEAGEPLCGHPDIDCITFTGSVPTGRRVMKTAAEHIKPVVLELGGKSPHIIFNDADPETAAAEVAKGIYANTGQICSAGSRLLVERGIADNLLEALVARSRKIRLGPGMEQPDMGPLVSQEHLDRVLGYIDTGKEQGARIITGGERARDKGYFVAPTVFTGVDPEMRIAQEEIFGPVLSVLTFTDEAQAAALANNVKYGLVAGIHTRDIDRAMRLARDLRVGQVYINEYFIGGEETPFGGYKQSGFGREKGLPALDNYTQLKNICVRIR